MKTGIICLLTGRPGEASQNPEGFPATLDGLYTEQNEFIRRLQFNAHAVGLPAGETAMSSELRTGQVLDESVNYEHFIFHSKEKDWMLPFFDLNR